MVEFLDNFIAHLGLLGLLVFGVAAALEYVVPPFPGDTITLLGGVYAVRGEHPWPLVFGVVVAGSVLGALINYQVGHWLGGRFEQRPGEAFLGITHARLESVQAQMRHKGPWLLLVNRFLPGIRGLIFVAAGAAHMPRVNALLLGALSAVAHTALVLALGVAVGGNLERLEFLVARYQRGVILGVALVVLVLGVRTLFRRQPRTG
ncbi:DedA family / putative alkaline phosphatase-like protein [Cystobacter fuscus DSM 2262]|uniref:DedA family / putative alkaline phosphatase-like protein n=1 Tax=Cystobacter fuscus (strain ATCC 25194 / DSM 2262 / NBRC 100088 / M29) TaxID=1242864 RepID=S9PER0_CYSF2|nr:DedA family protein [Cystobacter fuscus]EPX60852.1 DedA family / putative alkaline phosphatase-like protein [Cystobacter fuscus DSM 2262]